MQNMDVKRMAIEALRRKIRKMEMEDGCCENKRETEGIAGSIDSNEIGMNNIKEDAREVADTEAAANGEDGEKEVSIELEVEGDTETDNNGMEELYKRMRAEFGAESPARAASGKKVSMMGGKTAGKSQTMAQIMSKKGRK